MPKPTHVSAAALAIVLMLSAAVSSQTVLAKKGTVVYGTLQQTLDSKVAHDGDRFTLIEKDTWFHHNPALHGGTIEGHLEHVTPARATHKATMSVVFDDIAMPDGAVAPIHAQVLSLKEFEPRTHHLRDLGIIVGSAVAGHFVASRLGKKHGGLAGAVAGYALVTTMKSDIRLKPGTEVKLKIVEDATVASR